MVGRGYKETLAQERSPRTHGRGTGHTNRFRGCESFFVRAKLCTDTVRSDHWPITCSISTETRAQPHSNRTPCVVDWRSAPEWGNEQLAQATTDMVTSVDFETQRNTVAASLIHQKLFPSKLSEFRWISSLSTMRKLLGYVWLAAVGDTQFNSFQTRFLRKIDASHGFFCLGETKRTREGVEGTTGPQEGL